jgi:protein SCO1
MSRNRLLPPILLGVMGLSLLVGLNLGQRSASGDGLPWNSAPPAVQAVMWPEPRALAGFSMLDQNRQPFGPAQFQGHWSFVFFGYLGCPDICPSSLHAMREFKRQLERRDPGAAGHQFIFVSVDPEHDRPEAIREYLAWYQADFIGLSGSSAQIDTLARHMAIKYEEHIDETGYRSIDHSSSLMIIDPSGRVVGALPPPLLPERMVEQFQQLATFMQRQGI